MHCEMNACWVIFLQMTVNEQQNDANITVIYCSCFTVNSHYKVVFNCATVRYLVVYYCNCFEVIIMVIEDPICFGFFDLAYSYKNF